ncbi:MAG: hypothetical protein HY301_17660 [Verrucomicrobia bacterium]|nr:hypothetical protein [Verrucomicrobiota bacterium]
MSRRVYTGVVLLLLAPWVLLAVVLLGGGLLDRWGKNKGLLTNELRARRVVPGKPGPWGELHYTRISIEPPVELIRVEDAEKVPLRWVFPGYDPERLGRLFRAAELPEAQVQLLLNLTTAQGDKLVTLPPPELALGLSRGARQMIYHALAASPENVPQSTAFAFNPDSLEERFAGSGISPAAITLFKRLIYPHGKFMLFADLNLMLPQLGSPEEKLRFLKAVTRKTTMIIELAIRPDTDVDKLVQYWSFGGRAKDVRPLLESLTRVPGGCSLDIAHLLPPFARRRLFTYPVPDASGQGARQDAHWTSLNFFNATPDDSLADPAVALEHIKNDYYFIANEPRLGDLVLLMLPDARVVHSAVFIADEIVFTKNGASPTQPWRFTSVDGMVSYHAAFYPVDTPLRVLYARRKSE